jgi:RimJ/RimL family protein N-acetyltransferase
MSSLVFETPRLVIRPWTESPADVDFLFDMYSRWEVQRFLGAAPKVMQSRDDAVAAARRLSTYTAEQLFGSWAVTSRESGELVGTVLLKQLPLSADTEPLPLSDDVEVGWHLHPAAWSHGYATEAAEGALQRGFAAGLDDIFAVTYAENVRLAGGVPSPRYDRTRRHEQVLRDRVRVVQAFASRSARSASLRSG